MLRALLALCALLTLAACGAEPIWAPDDKVAAARYVHEGPTSITLFTVINNRSDAGAHSGLMINGSERIMFDPAGTWKHPRIPERNDVHYGITPRIVNFYIDYHARETFRVIEQTVIVSPGVAELVAQRAKAYGAVPKAQCANSITSILSGVPGFEPIRKTWYPNKLMEDFAKLPGVTNKVIRDEDADKNHGVLLVQAGQAPI
jgi:predicted small lipoprotein YifL